MNTINFRKALIELATQENSDSKIAKIIAHYYPVLNISSRESLFESLLNFYQISENQEFNFDQLLEELEKNSEIINTSNFVGKDFRIETVTISNIRGIPSLDESNNIPYGINLYKDGKDTLNSIILANNGTGKSSVFSGLEMIYANDIGEKNLRSQNYKDLTESDYFNYLKRFPNSSKPNCTIKTFEGEFSLENKIFEDELINIFNPKSHFITEFDIIENGRNTYNSNPNIDYSFHNIIAKNLGLDEFLNFISISEQIPSYRRRKEYTYRDSIQSEISTNILAIKNRNEEIEAKTIELEKLKEGNTPENTQNKSLEDLRLLRSILNKDISIVFNNDSYKSTITNYQKSYQEYLSIDVSNKNSNEKKFLESGKELIHYFDNCPFCLDSNKTKEEINAEVDKRLKDLESFEKIEKEIRENFRLLTSLLLTTVKDLMKVYHILEVERSQLSKFKDLDTLSSQENNLFISLSTHLNDDELIDTINNLSKIQFPNNSDFKTLFEITSNNATIILEYFPSNANSTLSIINQRKELLEQAIQKLSTNSEELSLEQKILKAENEIKELASSISSLNKRNEELEPIIEGANKMVGYFERIKLEIKNYNLRFNEKKDKLVTESFEPMKKIIEQIINDFIPKNERIELKVDVRLQTKLDFC